MSINWPQAFRRVGLQNTKKLAADTLGARVAAPISVSLLTASLALSTILEGTASAGNSPQLLSVNRIWNQAPHNAFTDLVRFDDAFYVAFREGTTHGVPGVGQPGGALRVLRSDDGLAWMSTALIEGAANEDLRDAKLSVTPVNQLMLEGAMAPHASPSERQSRAWFSDDGQVWSPSIDIGDANYWLWGVQWHDDLAYSIGYGPTTINSQSWTTRLYRSSDGANFQTHVPTLTTPGGTSEGALLFRDDDSAVALVRRDAFSQSARVGVSSGDFTQWTWQDSGVRVGGPELIEIPDGRIVAATRLYDGGARTALSFLDPLSGALDEFLELPSGGDTSYPGMVWHDERLWVSYYSSHEGKSSIYLAQVAFDATGPPPIRHVGDNDPLSEGWFDFQGDVPIANNGPVDDAGTAAWNIHDSSTAGGSREAYTRSLTADQLAQAGAEGWSFRGNLRVLDVNESPQGAIELSVFLDSDVGYILWFGADAAGNPIVGEFSGSASSGLAVGRTAVLDDAGYHDFEMAYDPGEQSVDVFADGRLIINNMAPADLEGNVLNRILWGSNHSSGTGNANYALVNFHVGAPLMADFDGDGDVDGDDLVTWQTNFSTLVGATNEVGDANGDGSVTGRDLLIWQQEVAGAIAAPSHAVPEPDGLALSLLLATITISTRLGSHSHSARWQS
ncbi:hypothetical protein OAS39_10855 [Pirellulales bacterium]|nr:hypothetical protein [Pirellulales bacterium]